MVIFIAFFAKSAQLNALGKAAIVPSFFNINEPILFGMPVVYNPYTAIPFFWHQWLLCRWHILQSI